MSDLGLSDDERRTLAAVLDEIIPPEEGGRLPGAGVLLDGGDLAGTLRSLPGLSDAITSGIAALNVAAHAHGADGFAALSRDERRAVLHDVGAADAGLLPSLMFLAYATYYRDRRVLETLGFEARPPHPKGYEVPENDLSLIEPVRRRGRLYREC